MMLQHRGFQAAAADLEDALKSVVAGGLRTPTSRVPRKSRRSAKRDRRTPKVIKAHRNKAAPVPGNNAYRFPCQA